MKNKQPVKSEGQSKPKSSSKAPETPRIGGAELWAVSQRAWLNRQPAPVAKSAGTRKSK